MIDHVSSNALVLEAAHREHRIQRKIAPSTVINPNPMAESEVRRYDRPPASTGSPLEYAYYLLGGVEGKTIVDLGCGEGVNTVILAKLGAKVLAIDSSEASLELTSRRAAANRVAAKVTLLHSDAISIPIRDAAADHVLCVSVLGQTDFILTARQIRRVLRPGGTAVFTESPADATIVRTMKTFLAEYEGIRGAQPPLRMLDVEAVSRAVGRPGRSRAFWLTTRLLSRMGIDGPAIRKASQRLDASLIRRFPSSRQFASPLVWEACKES